MVEYFVTKGKLVVRNGAPLVVLDGEEKALSQVEFILWTSLHWNVLNKESLKTEFDRRMKKYHMNGDVSFEQTLNRLKIRGLIAGKSDYLAVDALYNLVKDLYVVPLGTVNKFKRAMMFLYMFFILLYIVLQDLRQSSHMQYEAVNQLLFQAFQTNPAFLPELLYPELRYHIKHYPSGKPSLKS